LHLQPIDELERSHQVARGAVALNPGCDQEQLGGRPAIASHGDDVVQRRAVATRDHGHPRRVPRERTLAGGVEQAVFVERGLHPLEPALLVAQARRGQEAVDDELELALRLVQRGAALGEHLGAVGRGAARPLGIGAPHGAARLRGRVAEREVPVAAPVDLALHHFAANPDRAQTAFEHGPDRRGEVADREDLVGRSHRHRAHATACSNACSVFLSSIAIVIRPTPPGTGVMADATSATGANATSPTIRYPLAWVASSTRLMPTSITTAPGRTISAVTNSGLPIATIRMSAERQIPRRSRDFEWQIVTVASPPLPGWIRRLAMGLPTMLDRPTITALAPLGSIPDRSSISCTPYGVAGRRPVRSPMDTLPTFTGWNPSTSLRGLTRLSTRSALMGFGSG